MGGARKVVKHVESVDELKKLCEKATTFYLALNYGLYSRKTIRWDGKIFHVHNHVDESRQELNEAQLFTESNIGRGIERKALIYTDGGRTAMNNREGKVRRERA